MPRGLTFQAFERSIEAARAGSGNDCCPRLGTACGFHGKQADRKCLRKTFCTHLAMRGVDFWRAVKLMRHRDPKLTWQVYTELRMV